MTWFEIKRWVNKHVLACYTVVVLLSTLAIISLAYSVLDHQQEHRRYQVTQGRQVWVAWTLTYHDGCATLFLLDDTQATVCGTYKVIRLPNE